MKKFLRKIFSYFVLFLSIFIFLIFLFEKSEIIDNELNQHYLKSYSIILEKIKSCKSKKIVFVGGSNLGFGLNSERVEKELKIRTFNFGVQGGIGIKKPIEDIKKYINQEDVVIISPEYSNFNVDNYTFSKYEVDFFNNVNVFNFSSKEMFLSYLIFIRKTILSYFFSSNSLDSYSIHWFNSNGDVIGHHGFKNKNISKIYNEKIPNELEIYKLKSFLDLSFKNNTYFILPPVTNEFRFNNDLKKNLNFKFQKVFGDKLLLSIDEMTFDDSCFFDTQYHLNKQCKEIRTDRVIKSFYSNSFLRRKFYE